MLGFEVPFATSLSKNCATKLLGLSKQTVVGSQARHVLTLLHPKFVVTGHQHFA
jgi:hypothetical protein